MSTFVLLFIKYIWLVLIYYLFFQTLSFCLLKYLYSYHFHPAIYLYGSCAKHDLCHNIFLCVIMLLKCQIFIIYGLVSLPFFSNLLVSLILKILILIVFFKLSILLCVCFVLLIST